MAVLTRTLAALIFCALVWSATGTAAPPSALAVAGRANANVSLASRGEVVLAVWSAAAPSGETDIYASVSRNSGETFSTPVRVNSTAGAAQANGEQPPRAVILGAPPAFEIVVVWTAKEAAGTRLWSARSVDGGRTFSPSRLVPGTDAPGNRGWHAVAADGADVFVVWLDHRDLAEGGASGGHQHGQTASAASVDGVAMAQRSQLLLTSLTGSSAAPRSLARGVCYCCKTAAAVGAAGTRFLAWRHVYEGNMRDIAFTASPDGGRTFSQPVRVSEDRWAINGCPDDGPAMALDDRGGVHVIWPTVVIENGEPVKALFHAVSRDGRTFGSRTRLPTRGHANHPQIAAAGRELVVVWDESGDGSRLVAAARADATAATPSFTRAPLEASVGLYPAVAATPGGPLLMWTSGTPSDSVVRVARLPRAAATNR
jgi:hypothetical protein